MRKSRVFDEEAARWEDDELVTYDMKTLKLGVSNEGDDFINDKRLIICSSSTELSTTTRRRRRRLVASSTPP